MIIHLCRRGLSIAVILNQLAVPSELVSNRFVDIIKSSSPSKQEWIEEGGPVKYFTMVTNKAENKFIIAEFDEKAPLNADKFYE